MEYAREGNGILLRQADFDLDETLDCGQAFRWEKQADGSYSGAAMNRSLQIRKRGDCFLLENTAEEDFLSFWADYFDLKTDYGVLKQRYAVDETLYAATRYAGGIRLLRQDAWEALVSFVFSQNNHIPRIKGMIARLCALFGHFPTAKEIAVQSEDFFAPVRAGFRTKYLLDAARKVADGAVQPDRIQELSIHEARAELMQIKGVGPKVADCVLLYGMHRVEVIPMDVWMKRVMAEWYPDGFPDCTMGTEGIAQQYLFHYIRHCQSRQVFSYKETIPLA